MPETKHVFHTQYQGFKILDECDTVDEMKELITFAYEKYAENKQWLLYSCVYPHMTKDSFKTFDEFTGKKEKKKVIKQSRKETKKQEKNKVKNVLTDCMLILKAKL